MVPSHTSGDDALISDGHHGAVLQVATERDAGQLDAVLRREPAVTEPMKPLSLYLMWEYTMSRWRLLTGMSTGSHTVPPEWCRCGDMYASFTKFWKSASVA